MVSVWYHAHVDCTTSKTHTLPGHEAAYCKAADAMTSLKMVAEEPPLEKALLDAALSALRSEGNVLIPTDTVGRVLELLLILRQLLVCCMAQPIDWLCSV